MTIIKSCRCHLERLCRAAGLQGCRVAVCLAACQKAFTMVSAWWGWGGESVNFPQNFKRKYKLTFFPYGLLRVMIPLYFISIYSWVLYRGMSITRWTEQEPSRVRLVKALSWRYPNREYFNFLIFGNYRIELDHIVSLLGKQNSQIWGINEKVNRRIRLSRQHPLTTTKRRTKTNTLIHTPFRVSRLFVYQLL